MEKMLPHECLNYIINYDFSDCIDLKLFKKTIRKIKNVCKKSIEFEKEWTRMSHIEQANYKFSQTRKRIKNNPEEATKVLQSIGLLDENGEIPERYFEVAIHLNNEIKKDKRKK